MNEINRGNYQAWFLDYHEGNLDSDQTSLLHEFLDLNPDLMNEFTEFESFRLEPDEGIIYSGKESLKRSGRLATEADNELIIAFIENDLAPGRSAEVEARIRDDRQFRETYELFLLSKLEPDTSVVYDDHTSLKKPLVIETRSSVHRMYAFRAAAVVALLIAAASVFYFAVRYDAEPQLASGRIEQPSDMQKQAAVAGSSEYEQSEVAPENTGSGNAMMVDAEPEEYHTAVEGESNRIMAENGRVEAPEEGSGSVESAAVHDNEEQAIDKTIAEHQKSVPMNNIETMQQASSVQLDQEQDRRIAIYPTDLHNTVDPEEVQGLFKGLATVAKKQVVKDVKQDESRENTYLANAEDAYKKVRFMDMVGFGLGKLSNKKVKLASRHDDNGNLTAYDFSVGKVNVEKQQ